jgi:site-specific recombinase XerD
LTLPVPVGHVQDNRELPLSEAFRDAFAAAADYAAGDKADSTRAAYAADLRDFERWCVVVGAEPLPASVATVCAYLANLAQQRLKVSTVDRRAAAIAYGHRFRGLEPPTSAEPVKRVLRGIRRRTGVSVEAKAPATARAISGMLKRIPADTLTGKRDRALLAIGFAAALRRSELVALTVEDFERAPEGLRVHIRRSKTDQDASGHTVPVPAGSRLRPVALLDEWLAAAAITAGPVFLAIRKGGRISDRALTPQSVALIVKKWAKAAKLDPRLYAGHSLRAGFVTSALEHGADLLKVMAVTRHREVKTLQTYDRRAQAFKDHAGRGFL